LGGAAFALLMVGHILAGHPRDAVLAVEILPKTEVRCALRVENND